jgi:hypothetical protein
MRKQVERCLIVWVGGWEGTCLGGCLSEWWVAWGLGEWVAGCWPSRWGGFVGGQGRGVNGQGSASVQSSAHLGEAC